MLVVSILWAELSSRSDRMSPRETRCLSTDERIASKPWATPAVYGLCSYASKGF